MNEFSRFQVWVKNDDGCMCRYAVYKLKAGALKKIRTLRRLGMDARLLRVEP